MKPVKSILASELLLNGYHVRTLTEPYIFLQMLVTTARLLILILKIFTANTYFFPISLIFPVLLKSPKETYFQNK